MRRVRFVAQPLSTTHFAMNGWPLVVQARSRMHEQLSHVLLGRIASESLAPAMRKRSMRDRVRELLLDRICHDEALRTGTRPITSLKFEATVKEFFTRLLPYSGGLLPVGCSVEAQPADAPLALARFAQFKHVAELERLGVEEMSIRSSVLMGLAVDPNVLMVRTPLHDNTINERAVLVELTLARRSWLRERYQPKPLLHAALWCRASMSRDTGGAIRASARTLIHLRRGRAPHLVAVTCEFLPSRIVDVALAPGELDCCYHCALPELRSALGAAGAEEELDALNAMVQTQRLRDTSDLFLDLAM